MPAASRSRPERAASAACSGLSALFLAALIRFWIEYRASFFRPGVARSLMMAIWSSPSKIEKPRRSFARSCSICRKRSPSEWKVEMVRPSAASPFTRLATRSRISLAALLVKVMAAMCRASCRPVAIRWAIFSVITLVLPLPAPASTSRGPPV